MAKHKKNMSISGQSERDDTGSSYDLKQLHVNIPAALHKKFRIKVLEEGRSMNQVIEDLIETYINGKV